MIREDRKPLTGKMAELNALPKRSLFGSGPARVETDTRERRAALAAIEDANIVTADKMENVNKPRRKPVNKPAPDVNIEAEVVNKADADLRLIAFRLSASQLARFAAEAERAGVKPSIYAKRLVLAHLGEDE